ncbi:MAG: CpsD/CapB family tyrosine-protein kinase [Chloroflexi bacterium]|nr:CpsD/CapB family tyrosine-protein kinase [Chloroflexota bacterium]
MSRPVLQRLTIPLIRRRRNDKDSRPLLTTSHPRSPFAEAFRHLRTNLLYLSPDRPLRLLLVTSPGPEEAKSTVAVNLAAAMAQAGRRVWLVEADLRKPALAWTLGPEGTLGLTDLLVDGVPVDRALQGTEVDNLWFVPSGTIPPNPAELLGSQKMRALLEEARGGADAVVIDAPPVLPVTDAAVLAPNVDGVLLVVWLGHTPREAARRARERLAAVGARVVGVVVHGVEAGRRDGYYYYSRYYGPEEKAEKAATVGKKA